MTMFVIQTFLLIAIAFILGAIVGALLRQLSRGTETVQPVSKDKTTGVAQKAPPVKQPAKAPKPPKAQPKPARPAPVTKKAAKPDIPKDNLKRINGIGPKNEKALNALGIYSFSQIASWSSAQEAEMGEKMAFPGRIEREEWVKQAKALSQGKAPVAKAPPARRLSKDGPTTTTGQIKTETGGSKPAVLASPPADGGDDLALIDGVGQALERKLNDIGIYELRQIADWSPAEQAWIGNELGFPGRPEREGWVKEAARLAKPGSAKARAAPAKGEITAKRKTVIR